MITFKWKLEEVDRRALFKTNRVWRLLAYFDRKGVFDCVAQVIPIEKSGPVMHYYAITTPGHGLPLMKSSIYTADRLKSLKTKVREYVVLNFKEEQ